MNKVLKYLIVISLLTLLPLSYFFYRDLISSEQISQLDGCTPYNISWDNKESGTHVYWKTKDSCIGYIRYGQDPSLLSHIGVDVAGSARKNSHEVVINDTQAGSSYYLTIYSGDKVFGLSGQPIFIKIE